MRRINPLIGQEPTPADPDEVALFEATTVDELRTIKKSGPLSGAFGDKKKRNQKQIRRLKAVRGYKEPRAALGDKKKRKKKKRKAERSILSNKVKKHAGPGPHPSGSPQSIHGNWSRGLSAPQRLKDLAGGGFTVHVPTGVKPNTGWSVALGGHEDKRKVDKLTPRWVQNYRSSHQAILSREDTSWGAWIEDDLAYFDVSVVLDDVGEALELARSSDQIAIFNLETFEELYLDDAERIAELTGVIEKRIIIGFTPRRSATIVNPMSTKEIVKHAGPGPHPSGSSQDVHGGGGTTKVRVERSGGERPCLHPDCAILHWNKKGAVWDSGDHIVADNTWRAVDADTYRDLYEEGLGFDTKREAIAWAKENYPDLPIDSKPAPKAPKTPEPETDFWELTNIKQAKEMGMLGSQWVAMSRADQVQAWELKTASDSADRRRALVQEMNDLTKHFGPGPHPGTMSPQDVHGSGAGGASHSSPQVNASDEVLNVTEQEQRLPSWFEGRQPPPSHYWVNDQKIEAVEKKIGQLNRRGAKYGLEPFSYEIVDAHEQLVSNRDAGLEGHMGLDGEGQFLQSWSLVRVDGTPPAFEGWEFAGRIEHLPTMESEGEDLFNILHMRPDFEGQIPEQYRDSGPDCDVCQRQIYRKDTFLVHNTETGEWKQVGRNDLTLFTGPYDPAASAFYLQVFDDMEDDDFFEPREAWGNAYISDTDTYLAKVAAETREHGYVSASSLKDDFGRRMEGGHTTSEIVQDPNYYKDKWSDQTPNVSDADVALAADARGFYAAYQTPDAVAAYREYQKKYSFDDEGFYTGDTPDIYPPSADHMAGTYGWQDGNSAELYEQRVNFWKENVQGTPFDPTTGATIEHEIIDGIGVEVIHHQQSVTEKGMRDLFQLERNDSFMNNMKGAAMTPFTTRSNAGLQAYVVPGYQKHLAQVAIEEARASQPVSEWVGTVGEKMHFDSLRIDDVKQGQGNYGDWTLTKMHDQSGNLVNTWYGGKKIYYEDPTTGFETLWKPGDHISGTATVKSHEVDKYSDDQKVTTIKSFLKDTEVEIS